MVPNNLISEGSDMVENTPNLPTGDQTWWPHIVDPLRQLGAKIANFFTPTADAAALDDAYEVNLELPGVAEKDIEIEVREGVMTIKGEKRTAREEKGKHFYFSERSYGAFQRAFRLPADVDEDRIEAHADKGVLHVVLPKRAAAETTESRRIAVKSR
jgi:HSP20 family protein